MRRFLSLTRKETAAIFISPPVLFAAAFFVLLDSFAFFLAVSSPTALAETGSIAQFVLFTSVAMLPLVSMHSFSEDIASGTLESLLTAPVSHSAAVLAKFSGAMIFALAYFVHGLAYAALVSVGGDLDWNAALAGFLTHLAFASLALSLGVFISALTMSPLAAAAGSGGILVFLALVSGLDPYSGTVADILHSLSFLPHAKRWIAGELDTRGLVYFLSGTCLFLFYARLAIASRSLEKRSPNPTVRRRLAVTYSLVCAGFVLLLTQAALLHIKGFWEIGMPLDEGIYRIPRINLLPLGLAVAAFAWSALTLRAARRAAKNARKSRQAKYATISEAAVMAAPSLYYKEDARARRRMILAAAAALALVVNVNWLAHYPFRTFSEKSDWAFLAHLQGRSVDVTLDRRNSLSPATRHALDMLQGRVDIYSFIPADLRLNGIPVADEIRRLLERYADHNALVSITFADARRESTLAGELADRLELPRNGLENFIVAEYQGRRLALPAGVLVSPPERRRRPAGDKRWLLDGENRLTQTIVRLMDPRTPDVFFAYGHLEHNIVAGNNPRFSASRLAAALRSANMRVRQHLVNPVRPIPPDCDILAIVAPIRPFGEKEVANIRAYLNDGGRLLVVAPQAGGEYNPVNDPLTALLFEIGGSFRHDSIADAEHHAGGDPGDVLGVGKLAGDNLPDMIFPATRSIRDNPMAEDNGWRAERIIETHPDAVATSLNDRASRMGPFTLAYRSARLTGAREARVAAVAAGRMAADSDFGRGANEAFLTGLVQWLAGREEIRGIESRQWVDRRIHLTGPQFRLILWIGVVGLPLVWLVAGITVWWMRRE